MGIVKDKSWSRPAALLVFCLAYAASRMTWLALDRSLNFISDATHLLITVNQYANLKILDFRTFFLVQELYPNLYHNISAILALGTGSVEASSSLLNLLFVALTAGGAYLLGSTLWDEDTGLLSAVLVPAFPWVEKYSIIDNIDVATAAFTVLALWALIKSERFSRRGHTLAFFAFCGLGMLTKWAFAFFMAVPFLVVFVPVMTGLLKDSASRRPALIYLGSALLYYPLLLAAAGLFPADVRGYPPFDGFFVFYLIVTLLTGGLLLMAGRAGGLPPAVGSLTSGTAIFFLLINHYYLFCARNLFMTYVVRFWMGRSRFSLPSLLHQFWVEYFGGFIGPVLLILALLGLALYGAARKEWRFDRGLALICAVSGLLIVEAQPTLNSRYFLPLAGILPSFMVWWIVKIPRASLRRGMAAALVAFSLLTWAGWILLPPGVTRIPHLPPVQRPSPVEWRMDAPVQALYADWANRFPGSRGAMIVLYNQLAPDALKPLVFSYFAKKHAGPRDEVFYLTRGIGLSLAYREGKAVPMVYFVERKQDGRGEEDDGDDRQELESSIDMAIEDARPDAIYLIHCRRAGMPAEVPPGGLRPIHSRLQGRGAGDFTLIQSFPWGDGGMADLFRLSAKPSLNSTP